MNISQQNINNMIEALQRIIYVRDYNAEYGEYPEGYMADDQCFDDWAADIAETVLRSAQGSDYKPLKVE